MKAAKAEGNYLQSDNSTYRAEFIKFSWLEFSPQLQELGIKSNLYGIFGTIVTIYFWLQPDWLYCVLYVGRGLSTRNWSNGQVSPSPRPNDPDGDQRSL